MTRYDNKMLILNLVKSLSFDLLNDIINGAFGNLIGGLGPNSIPTSMGYYKKILWHDGSELYMEITLSLYWYDN